MTTTFYPLQLRGTQALIAAVGCVVGGLILPQLCHLIPQGGLMLLPIYFFTLFASYKYGLQTGLLTAVLTPVCNSLLFGMPHGGVLLPILIKSVLLAVVAAGVARKFRTVNIWLLLGVVLTYQVVGSLVEAALTHSLAIGFQDFRIGMPGMVLQVVGGYALMRRNIKH